MSSLNPFKSSNKSTTSSTTNTTSVADNSLNAAEGATVVGAGGTLINQSLDADLAAETLRTSEEVSRAALEANNRATDGALIFADETNRTAFDAVTSNTSEALDFADRANESAVGFGRDALRSNEEISLSALESNQRTAAASLDFGRDAIDAVGLANENAGRNILEATRESFDFASDFGGKAVSALSESNRDVIDFSGRALDTVAGVNRDSLDFADRFGSQSLAAVGRATSESIDLASDLNQQNARLAESITKTAVENLEKNKRDPDSDVIQTLGKYAGIAASIIAVVVGILTLSSRRK